MMAAWGFWVKSKGGKREPGRGNRRTEKRNGKGECLHPPSFPVPLPVAVVGRLPRPGSLSRFGGYGLRLFRTSGVGHDIARVLDVSVMFVLMSFTRVIGVLPPPTFARTATRSEFR